MLYSRTDLESYITEYTLVYQLKKRSTLDTTGTFKSILNLS